MSSVYHVLLEKGIMLVLKINLYGSFYTVCFITEEHLYLHNLYIADLKVKARDLSEFNHSKCVKPLKKFKFTSSGFFLRQFLQECSIYRTYRSNVLKNLKNILSDSTDSIFLKLILEPPGKEIIDYAWNERISRLVWTRVEIENAFSWLSTLGGAYSALGDYFLSCAEEAGQISLRQYKLSKMLGDESLAARSRLYSALSNAQKGNLKLSRAIVRHTAVFARRTNDVRLMRMCQGVWAKLKYLRRVRKSSPQDSQKAEYNVNNGKCLVQAGSQLSSLADNETV